MSVGVEVIMARHEDVLLIPVAAVLETKAGFACWVSSKGKSQRRPLQLGDSSNMFIVVEDGLQEGDEVILDPLAHIEEAQLEAAATLEETNTASHSARRPTDEA
jgi:multidrug efflux pump subunit AcrA (membrane-fusion protein)